MIQSNLKLLTTTMLITTGMMSVKANGAITNVNLSDAEWAAFRPGALRPNADYEVWQYRKVKADGTEKPYNIFIVTNSSIKNSDTNSELSGENGKTQFLANTDDELDLHFESANAERKLNQFTSDKPGTKFNLVIYEWDTLRDISITQNLPHPSLDNQNLAAFTSTNSPEHAQRYGLSSDTTDIAQGSSAYVAVRPYKNKPLIERVRTLSEESSHAAKFALGIAPGSSAAPTSSNLITRRPMSHIRARIFTRTRLGQEQTQFEINFLTLLSEAEDAGILPGPQRTRLTGGQNIHGYDVTMQEITDYIRSQGDTPGQFIPHNTYATLEYTEIFQKLELVHPRHPGRTLPISQLGHVRAEYFFRENLVPNGTRLSSAEFNKFYQELTEIAEYFSKLLNNPDHLIKLERYKLAPVFRGHTNSIARLKNDIARIHNRRFPSAPKLTITSAPC